VSTLTFNLESEGEAGMFGGDEGFYIEGSEWGKALEWEYGWVRNTEKLRMGHGQHKKLRTRGRVWRHAEPHHGKDFNLKAMKHLYFFLSSLGGI
jgi:hypothetical protein